MSQYESGGGTTERPTIGEGLDPSTLDTNVLVAGPTLCGKRAVAFDILASAYEADARSFAITTTDTADGFRTRFDPFTPPDRAVEDVIVVDSHRVPTSSARHDHRTYTVDSPGDLTGIGINLWEGCESLSPDERQGGRVLIDDFSTFSIYSSTDRLLEFVSTCNNNVTDLGLSTVMVASIDAVDDGSIDRLRKRFPTIVEVTSAGDTTKVRLRGQETTNWSDYTPSRVASPLVTGGQ
jgi:hypothetical protein